MDFFVQSRHHIHYVDDKGVPRSTPVEVHFGSQWMSLTRSFVSYVVHGMTR